MMRSVDVIIKDIKDLIQELDTAKENLARLKQKIEALKIELIEVIAEEEEKNKLNAAVALLRLVDFSKISMPGLNNKVINESVSNLAHESNRATEYKRYSDTIRYNISEEEKNYKKLTEEVERLSDQIRSLNELLKSEIDNEQERINSALKFCNEINDKMQ